MMTTLYRAAILALLVAITACGGIDRPTAPSAVQSQPPVVATPPRPAEWPPLSGPARIFDFSEPLSYRVSVYTTMSRYVLYDDGTFALQYLGFQNPYPGRYREETEHITFSFGNSGSSGAVGTRNGDLLEVRYSEIMQHSDFENAVYKRSQ